MFINFFLNSEVPAKLKCNPSLGAYKEETGTIICMRERLAAVCLPLQMHLSRC
jgi:hypothetical protein